MTPRFLTEWERLDYEREQRGEKPLGPPVHREGIKPGVKPKPSPGTTVPKERVR